MTPQGLFSLPSTAQDAPAPQGQGVRTQERPTRLPAALLPVYALWGLEDATPKKGDPQKVYAAVRLMVDGCEGLGDADMRLEHVCGLTAADARTHITPKRLFDFVTQRLKTLKLGWKVVEKWPGKRVVTDLWAAAFREEMGKSYVWDLAAAAHAAAFTSKDHEGAMAVVATVGHMVMVGGCQDEEDMLPWADWFRTPPDRLDIGVEDSSCALREGQLVKLDGARWRPSRGDGEDHPEAVVVALTDGGYTLDRSQRAIVEAAVSAAMSAYIHETHNNRGDPRLRNFAGNLGRYVPPVLSANAEAERQKVIAFRFLPGGHQPTRAERERMEAEAAQEPEEQEQPDALDWRRYVGVRS